MNKIVNVKLPKLPHLNHEVELTGHSQRNLQGRLYYEGKRLDNGLFEMIPAEWIECREGK